MKHRDLSFEDEMILVRLPLSLHISLAKVKGIAFEDGFPTELKDIVFEDASTIKLGVQGCDDFRSDRWTSQ